MVLNLPSSASSASNKSLLIPVDNEGCIPIDKIYVVLSELRRLLGECVLYERSSIINNSVHGDNFNSYLSSPQVHVHARDCPSFGMASDISFNLTKINLSKLLTMHKTDKKLYIQLHTLLCMHASIALSLEVIEITDRYDKCVAYQIGQKILTANDIYRLCGEYSAFRETFVA